MVYSSYTGSALPRSILSNNNYKEGFRRERMVNKTSLSVTEKSKVGE